MTPALIRRSSISNTPPQHHAIIGAGNLGLDLQGELLRQSPRGTLVTTLSRSNGFEIEHSDHLLDLIMNPDFTHIWYCVGYGSVDEADRNADYARFIHVTAPTTIAECVPPRVKVMLFSSDCAADEMMPGQVAVNPAPRSYYAKLKILMEDAVRKVGRGNTTIVRLGSLYGYHKPEQTFPGKILKRFALDDDFRIRLPGNLVTPTPTLWVAAMLAQNLGRLFDPKAILTHHCAPNGNLSIWDWAVLILSRIRDEKDFDRERFLDDRRPHLSALGCSFLERNWHWHDCWKTYYRPRWFVSKDVAAELPLDIEPSEVAGMLAL